MMQTEYDNKAIYGHGKKKSRRYQTKMTNRVKGKEAWTYGKSYNYREVEYENCASNNAQSEYLVVSGVQNKDPWKNDDKYLDDIVQQAKKIIKDTCEEQYDSEVVSVNADIISYSQKVVYCEPCHIGQTVIQAHGFCTNCAEHLCKSCCRSHKNHKAFKDHVLQNKDEMPTDDKQIAVEDHCLKHEDKRIEYYCTSCEELACTVCMFKHHRSCQNVDYIPDIAETLEDTDEYKELAKDMNNLATKCTTGMKSLEASLNKSEESKDMALLKIKMEIAEIKKVFDRLETKMNNTVQARYRMEQGKLIGLKGKHKALTGQLEMTKKKIEYSRKARQMIKFFISVKKERKPLDNLENELQKLKQENDILSYTFKASKSVEDMKVLLEIGELHTDDKASDCGTLMVPGAIWNPKQSALNTSGYLARSCRPVPSARVYTCTGYTTPILSTDGKERQPVFKTET